MPTPAAQFPVKGVGFGRVEEPAPRVLTPVWTVACLVVGVLGVVVSVGALRLGAVCVGLLAGLFVAGARLRMVGFYDQRVVPRIWLRPDGLDLAVVGRHAVTYRYEPWRDVVRFGFEEPDAIWETGSQAYAELSTEDPDVSERVRIGSVTPDFPAAVRHYSAGAHEVSWPTA
jgi:hypothetical protein